MALFLVFIYLLPSLFYNRLTVRISLFLFYDVIQCEICFYEYALITLTIYSVLQLSNGMTQLTMANSLRPTQHGPLTMGQLVKPTCHRTMGQYNN